MITRSTTPATTAPTTGVLSPLPEPLVEVDGLGPATDGDEVGTGEVGASVVGEMVGSKVVGDCVGDVVGFEAVGETVGSELTGVWVGDTVGPNVVGKSVGALVGSNVVGGCVGPVSQRVGKYDDLVCQLAAVRAGRARFQPTGRTGGFRSYDRMKHAVTSMMAGRIARLPRWGKMGGKHPMQRGC